MLLLPNITSDASQSFTLTGIPGVTIAMTLRYMPRAQLWVAGFNDGTTSIQNISVVTSLNILRPWKNNINYGIGCFRGDGLDPYLITDFSEGIASLYLLDSSDVAAIEENYFA